MQEFDSFLKFPFESFQTFFLENFSNVCNNFYKDRPPDINKLHISMCNFQIFLIKFVKTNKKKLYNSSKYYQKIIPVEYDLYKIQEPRKLYNCYKKYKNKNSVTNKRIFQLLTIKTNNFTISFNLKSLTALQKFTISSTITSILLRTKQEINIKIREGGEG